MKIFEKMLAFLIAFVVIFTAGVQVGKKLERDKQESIKVVQNPFVDLEEEMSTEEVLSAEAELPTAQPVEQGGVNSASGNDTASGNDSASGNDTAGGNQKKAPLWNEGYSDTSEKLTLAQRAAVRTSYDETLAINQQDKAVIAGNTLDFSEMKIACLGDSITEGIDGNTPYPTFLKEILGAKEIYNFGIGGSTIASGNGVAAMTERSVDIPKDIDLILVIGGTNDNFQQASWQFGFMDWETKGEGTFCGDLQLLMRKFKWSYPNAKVIFFTPPSNSKIDQLKKENPALLDQSKYAEAINYIGREEKTQVVDLFNANFLNSHDANIMSHFMHDNVHGNTEGNRLLAERVASEIIKRYQ